MVQLTWPRRLVVICRGETAAEVVLREAEERGCQEVLLEPGASRSPLSARGLETAREAGKRLFATAIRPHAVFVAPELAARQTAVQVLRAIGLELEEDLPAAHSLISGAKSWGKLGELGFVWPAVRGSAPGTVRVEIWQEERLRDRDEGALLGLTSLGRKKVMAAFRNTPGILFQRPPGGESHADVALRSRSFLAELGRHFAGETLLL
ncbi:MAG: histidine phosphatase family protein, partial [Cyanobacteria bacterium NC_groundwater_1444_Ag_S-0.65um_54_12]|nr:histidine phosphatase family protein [Cyanobacteria bacterium NC_groundwater_1444_Ag_S-0.65um_54_12]